MNADADEIKALKIKAAFIGGDVDTFSTTYAKNVNIRGDVNNFAAGKIKIKADMADLERELLSFPNGAHDDIVDALSMQIGFWYQIGEEEKQYEEDELNKNMMIGKAIIEELTGRAFKLNRYPYDVGINADASRSRQFRSYSYA